MDINLTDRQEAFFTWLSSRVSMAQLSDYRQLFQYVNSFAKQKRLTANDIISISKIDTVRKIRTAFETNRLFRFINRGKTDKISTLLRHYEAFLSEGSSLCAQNPTVAPVLESTCQASIVVKEKPNELQQTEEPTTLARPKPECDLRDTQERGQLSNKKRFTFYLNAEGFDAETINIMLCALEYTDSVIRDCQLDVSSLCDAPTVQEAAHTYSELLMCSAFQKKDAISNGMMSKAISAYFAMLRSENVDATTTIHATTNNTQETNTEASKKIDDALLGVISSCGLVYIDKRPQSGRLWVIGDSSLNAFFDIFRKSGYEFRYVPNGGKSTEGKSAWYLLDSISTVPNIVCSEIDILLSDEKFDQLRESLEKERVLTIDQLKSIKLWEFMNVNNLYSLARRHEIAAAVQELVFPQKQIDMSTQYTLRVGDSTYTGTSPSETLIEYSAVLTHKYPLKFRNIIGLRSPEGLIVFSKEKPDGDSLSLSNPVVYVNANYTATQVVQVVEWISFKCGESVKATIDEPDITQSAINQPAISEAVIDKLVDQTAEHAFVDEDAQSDEETLCVPSLQNKHQEVLSAVESTQDVNPIVRLVEEHLFKADMDGLTLDALQDKMNITMVSLKQLIQASNLIAQIRDRVYHVETLIDWEEGANKLESILEKLMMKNDGYVSAAQLYDYARMNMNMFLNDNDMNDERSVYDMAVFLFEKISYHGKRFKFYGKAHISRVDAAVHSNFDIFCKFAEEQGGYFTLAELEDYMKKIGLKTGNLRQQMKLYDEPHFIYYDEGVVLYTKLLQIDDAWKKRIAKALASLFSDVGDHIILRDVQLFWYDQLPQLPGNRAWTPLLLQGILRHYSKELGAHTIRAMEGQALDTVHAMLVSNESPVQNFGDAVAAYLIENSVDERQFEAEDLRLMLVSAGMLRGNELIWNMHKALSGDERYAWDAKGERVSAKF